jgi:hypothetical protein
MNKDFVIGIELTVQYINGGKITSLGSYPLTDATMQKIFEDVTKYLQEEDHAKI